MNLDFTQKKIRVYNKVLNKIKYADKIALVSHKNPDCDTIGSTIGTYEVIKNNFSKKEVDLICVDDIPKKFSFIDYTNEYKKDFNPNDYDLIIFFDSGSKTQTSLDKKYPKLFNKKTYNTINIDHHITNDIYGKQNIILTNYTSTTSIMYELFKLTDCYISTKSAQAFLTGIYTDSGGLKHSNVNSFTYIIISELIKLGGDISIIVNNLFKKNKLNVLKLWGKIIGKSFLTKEKVLYTYVNKTDLDSYGVSYEEVSGIIDYLNIVEGIKYCIVLTQKGDYISGSLRTLRNDIDLTKIAGKYGGGGHKKASGFTTIGKIKENKNLDLNIQ